MDNYEEYVARHNELFELVSAIWTGEANYYDHESEMKELYAIGGALRWHENSDVRLIGKRTKQLLREIEEHLVLQKYYAEGSKQIEKSHKTMRKINNSLIQAIIRIQGEGEVDVRLNG